MFTRMISLFSSCFIAAALTSSFGSSELQASEPLNAFINQDMASCEDCGSCDDDNPGTRNVMAWLSVKSNACLSNINAVNQSANIQSLGIFTYSSDNGKTVRPGDVILLSAIVGLTSCDPFTVSTRSGG